MTVENHVDEVTQQEASVEAQVEQPTQPAEEVRSSPRATARATWQALRASRELFLFLVWFLVAVFEAVGFKWGGLILFVVAYVVLPKKYFAAGLIGAIRFVSHLAFDVAIVIWQLVTGNEGPEPPLFPGVHFSCPPSVEKTVVEERIVEKLVEKPVTWEVVYEFLAQEVVAFWALHWKDAVLGATIVLLVAVLFLLVNVLRSKTTSYGFVSERAVEGSRPMPSNVPDFVAQIWAVVGGRKIRGTCFRVGDSIHTAKHVVEQASEVYIDYRGTVAKLGPCTELDFDWVKFEYEPVSHLQMGAGKFAKASCFSQAFATDGAYSTMGSVTAAHSVGFVSFSGTTLQGYSGCPYFIGRNILGMHIGAGAANLGYDGAFMQALMEMMVKRPVGFKAEAAGFTTDATELYEQMREAGDKLEYRVTSNDYYVVKVGSVYKTYSEEEFESALEKFSGRKVNNPSYQGEKLDWHSLIEGAKRLQAAQVGLITGKVQFPDNEGNGSRPAAGVSTSVGRALSEEVQSAQPQDFLPEGKMDSPAHSAKMVQSLIGQTSQAALQSVLLRSTPENLEQLMDLIVKMGLTTRELSALRNLHQLDTLTC